MAGLHPVRPSTALALTATLLLLGACERRTLVVQADDTEPADLAIPKPVDHGWIVWRTRGPVLVPYVDGRNRGAMSCLSNVWRVQVRGLTPAQAFPQPKMTIHVNDVDWAVTPTASLVGDEAQLEASIVVGPEPARAMNLIKAWQAPSHISVDFDGQHLDLPDIDAKTGAEFGRHCARLWDFVPTELGKAMASGPPVERG